MTPDISTQNDGSLESMRKVQAAQTLEAPEATVQDEARPQILDDMENVDGPLKDALPPEWDNSENVDNPHNWSSWWKYGIIALVSFIELLTHLTSMLYAPGIPAMQRDFDSHNNTLATFSMSIYVLGFSVGPLVFAPLSEVYGRVVIYRGCLAVFLCFTVACALSSSINMLVGFRFVAGCFGAAPVAIGGAMVYDLFRVDERGVAMAIYHSGPIFGNLLGPPLGGLIIQHKSWRWVFWVITIFAGFALLCSFFILKETHAPTVLHKLYLSRKADVESDANEPTPTKPDPADKLSRAIKRPLKLLFFSPVVIACSLIISIVSGTMNLIFTSLGGIFQDQYGFSTSASGLTYLGVTIGFLIAAVVFGRTSDRISRLLMKRNEGKREAESRLPPMMVGLPLVVAGLFWYGWSAQNHVFWLVPVLGLNLFGMGVTTIQLSLQTYVVDSFTEFSASALAATTVTRCIGGSLIPLLGPVLYQRLGLGWGNSLMAFLNLALCVVPCVLFVKGKLWREKYLPKNF